MRKVRVLTDHLPLVYCARKTFGRAASYSRMCAFLGGYPDTEFVFEHIAGISNPADSLSRVFAPPEILPVTSVAGRCIQPPQTPPFPTQRHTVVGRKESQERKREGIGGDGRAGRGLRHITREKRSDHQDHWCPCHGIHENLLVVFSLSLRRKDVRRRR